MGRKKVIREYSIQIILQKAVTRRFSSLHIPIMCWAPLEQTCTRSTKRCHCTKKLTYTMVIFCTIWPHHFTNYIKFYWLCPIFLLCNLYTEDALQKDDLSSFFKSLICIYFILYTFRFTAFDFQSITCYKVKIFSSKL